MPVDQAHLKDVSSRIQRDYVSFSAANKECGWFRLCRLNHLQVDENMWVQQPDGKFAQVPFDWLEHGGLCAPHG